MLELLIHHRLLSLRKQYKKVMSEAVNYMQNGNLKEYLHKLMEASKIRNEYSETLTLQA
ncbi:MAG: hypothetical protein KatS3mg031_0382 [Chitinophagales bacterium]|nr:MAG: hypothetical protein KatS3mg031_0382 [Chitinophagales bacterium]